MMLSRTNQPSLPQVGFLAIGRKRPGFDGGWAAEMVEAAWSAVQAMDIMAVRPETCAVDDASLRRAIDEFAGAGCETLLVLQPSMGDGRLAPVLAQLFPRPVVFWATPERPDGGKVSSCSLVGAHVYASLFRQLGRPFEIVSGNPADEAVRRQLMAALRLCAAGARLRRSKVGLVGNHAPGFINMQADPALMARALGLSMQHFGLDEFIGLATSQDQKAVEADVDRVMAMNLPMEEGLGRRELAVDSRFYLAMRSLLDEESLDALAVRCWPELPNRLGQWPYLAMSRLAQEGRVVALEGDLDGAVSCLIGRLLGAGIGYLSDWLEHDEHTINLWHPGHAPLEFCQPGTVRLGRHFNNGLPLVVNAVLAVDRPITLFRLWRCDGEYRMTAWEARTAPPRRPLSGADILAVVEDRNVGEWFDTLCHEGMPHHVIVLAGHQAGLLRRFARQMGIAWV